MWQAGGGPVLKHPMTKLGRQMLMRNWTVLEGVLKPWINLLVVDEVVVTVTQRYDVVTENTETCGEASKTAPLWGHPKRLAKFSRCWL